MAPIQPRQIHSKPDPAGITYRSELARKAIHISSLWIVGFMLLMPKIFGVLALFILLELSFLIDLERQHSPRFGRWLHRWFGFMMRPHELEMGREHLVITGATWVLASAVLTFLLFPKTIAIAAFSMLILCDTAAALVGRRWGRIRFGPKRKSVEGSLAFLVVAIGVALVVPGLDWRVGLLGAIAAMIGEALPGLDDNFQVPLAAGVAMVAATTLLG